MNKYIYDERIGCVAVYPAPKRNCLSGISIDRETLYYRDFDRDFEQDGIAWIRDNRACDVARTICEAMNAYLRVYRTQKDGAE